MQVRFIRIFGFFLLAALVAGCAVNPATGRRELAVLKVSTEQEIAIGAKTFPQVVQQMGGEYPDPRLQEYVQQIGARLGKLSHRPDLPYNFRVVNDSAPNAFALPGGFIGISRGLLVHMENEAQLASVLGHEIGHVTARHSVQALQRGALLNLALAVVGGATGDSVYGTAARQTSQLAAQLMENSYSREQELESDRLGIDYMVAARYDPQGSVQVMDFFHRVLEGGSGGGRLSGMFRTHPFSAERMRDNAEYILARHAGILNHPDYPLRPEPFLAATARLRESRQGYELYEEARRLEAQGNLPKAVATYLMAATAAPDESLILAGLGMAYLKADDLGAARRHLGRAVQLQGEYHLSRLGLGYALAQLGENQRAVVELEKAMALLPTLQGAFVLAETYEKVGERQKALELYRSVAQADPQGRLGKASAERVRVLAGP